MSESPWIAFEDQMPTPPHGRILVTNNVGAKEDVKGEVKAYAELLILRNLTHWRPALPEEWPAECAGPEAIEDEEEYDSWGWGLSDTQLAGERGYDGDV